MTYSILGRTARENARKFIFKINVSDIISALIHS